MPTYQQVACGSSKDFIFAEVADLVYLNLHWLALFDRSLTLCFD